jgi:Uma2 family endonuclease
MSLALQRPWTLEQFLRWAGAQDGRYEFDGMRPVAMTGGSARHSRVTANIHAALRSRLRGTGSTYCGPDLGVQTIASKVSYPDALITCATFPDSAQLAPEVRVVFEVLSPTSGQTDRIEKVREYAAVPSIRRYVIVETRSAGVLVLHLAAADEAWTALALTGDEILDLPEVGLAIPIVEFYEDVDFGAEVAE